MYILAIETTGAFASVALAKAEFGETRAKNFEILNKVQGHDKFSHLQNLTPQIQQVIEEGFACEESGEENFEEAACGEPRMKNFKKAVCDAESCTSSSNKQSLIGNVDLIAVSQGPGSFTGIRIGVSTARALSQVTGIPCVAVPTLEALSMRRSESKCFDPKKDELTHIFGCSGESTFESDESLGKGQEADEDIFERDTLVCPILDARRGQVYGGGYMLKDGFPTEVIPAGAYTIDEFMELIDEAARGELFDAAVSGDESTSNEAASDKIAIPKFNCIKFLGDGVDAYAEKIEGIYAKDTDGPHHGLDKLCFLFAPEEARYQDAESVARLAAKMHFEGKSVSFEDLKPEYMRLAEAERKLREKRESAEKE